MATVLNRTTKQLILSANTPEYDVADWIINPDLSDVNSLPPKYWNIVGDAVQEMSQAEKDAVDAALAPSAEDTAREVIRAAMRFAEELQENFIIDNLLLGITQRGLTKHVRVVLKEVNDAMSTGSLYDAIDELSKIRPEDFDDAILTAARLKDFRNKIEAYLGLPLAEKWDD